MAESNRKPDVDEVVTDPAEYFTCAIDVVKDPRFTREEKQRILESWALDAELLSQADDENMPGPDRPRLREVKLALLELQRQH